MAILFRYLFLLLALLGALGAPVATFYAMSAYQRWTHASSDLERVRAVHAGEEARRQRLAAYEDYAKQSARFLAAAQNNGTVGAAWNSYRVDLKDELLSVTQLFALLDNARNANGYYFRPQRLDIAEISRLDKAEGLSRERKEKLNEKLKEIKEKHIARGSSALVTAQGEYLVYNRE